MLNLRSDALLPGQVQDHNSRLTSLLLRPALRPESLHQSSPSSLDSKNSNGILASRNADDSFEELALISPSKIILRYPDRNARDATSQTPGRHVGTHLSLPSAHVDVYERITGDGEIAKNEQGNVLKTSNLDREEQSPSKENMYQTTPIDANKKSAQSRKRSLTELGKKKKMLIANKRSQMNVLQRFIYDFRTWYQQHSKRFFSKWGIWSSHLRNIESRFGTGIGSYFILYRWTFVMNLFLASIWIAFVMIIGYVQMLQNNGYGVELFWRAHQSDGYWNIPNLDLMSNATSKLPPKHPLDYGILIQEFLSGKGSFQRSFFFYGNYRADIQLGGGFSVYSMDVAYFLIVCFTYLISAILIIRRIKTLFISRPGLGNFVVDDYSPFGTAVFCSWDYRFKTVSAVENQHYAVTMVLKTLLSHIEIKKKNEAMSQDDYTRTIIRRIVGNLVTIVLLAGTVFMILVTMTIENDSLKIGGIENFKYYLGTSFIQTLRGSQFISITAFVVSFFNFMLPLLFTAIGKFERYTNPNFEASITLARSFITKIGSIYVILISFYMSNRTQSNMCWENEIGRTLYQLVWTNLIFTLLGSLLHGTFILVRNRRDLYNFALANNILEIIYRQALLWIGCVFCPFVMIASLIAGWMVFFVKKLTLTTCGLPPKRIYNAYKQSIVFSFFLLITLGLMTFPAIYSVTRMKPTCGPYSPALQMPPLDAIYEIIPRKIHSLGFTFIGNALTYVSSFEFLFTVIVILSIWLYYQTAVSHKRHILNKQLQYEVVTERADKRYLLRQYQVKL